MGPTFNFKKIKKKLNKITNQSFHYSHGQKQKVREFVIFYFFFKSSIFDSQSSDRRISSGQTRKVLYATKATREYQKHEILPKIQLNIRKIQIFIFSQIYGVLLVP